MKILILSILGAFLPLLSAQEFTSWSAYLENLKSDNPQVAAVILGSKQNTLPREIASGATNMQGVQTVLIESNEEYVNPLTNQKISGRRLFAMWGANAGTLIFLNKDGLAIPQLALPQSIHANERDIVESYAGYVHEGEFNHMTLRDYLQAKGRKEVIRKIQMTRRTMQGWKPFLPGQPLPLLLDDNGTVVDARKHPGTFFIFGDPSGRAFNAQIREIQLGLGNARASIIAVIPNDRQRPPTLPDSIDTLFAKPADVLEPCSPRIMMCSQDGSGIEMNGFHPKDVLAMRLGLNLADLAPLQADVPFTETDTGSLHDVR